MISGTWIDELGAWIAEWNTPGTLGDVLPWAISGLIAVCSSAIAVATRKRQRVREQALQVSVWIEEEPGKPRIARVRNSSRSVIQDILVAAYVDDAEAQIFTTGSIGPERSFDFPLRSSTPQGPVKFFMRFSDSDGRKWEVSSERKLRRSGGVPKPFLNNLVLDEQAKVTDHSAATGPGGERLQLGAGSFSRIDIDEQDGNNISVVLVPKGAKVSPASVAEYTQSGSDEKLARVFLDDSDKVVKITVCNLPADTREHCYLEEMGGPNYHFMCFGKRGEGPDRLLDPGLIGNVLELGGKHQPIDIGVRIAYDHEGHLRSILIPHDRLLPGFLKYKP